MKTVLNLLALSKKLPETLTLKKDVVISIDDLYCYPLSATVEDSIGGLYHRSNAASLMGDDPIDLHAQALLKALEACLHPNRPRNGCYTPFDDHHSNYYERVITQAQSA